MTREQSQAAEGTRPSSQNRGMGPPQSAAEFQDAFANHCVVKFSFTKKEERAKEGGRENINMGGDDSNHVPLWGWEEYIVGVPYEPRDCSCTHHPHPPSHLPIYLPTDLSSIYGLSIYHPSIHLPILSLSPISLYQPIHQSPGCLAVCPCLSFLISYKACNHVVVGLLLSTPVNMPCISGCV